MPKIDFYILPVTDEAPRLRFACRLIEKLYQQRHRIYIHTQNQTQAHQLDELLWTYQEESFLPHNLYGEGPESAPPIQIGFDTIPENQHDILMNLASSAPEFYIQFSRILEVISSSPDVQAAGRENYRFYRAKRCEITTHKLQSVEA